MNVRVCGGRSRRPKPTLVCNLQLQSAVPTPIATFAEFQGLVQVISNNTFTQRKPPPAACEPPSSKLETHRRMEKKKIPSKIKF
jgi:hypothetical protein